MKTFLPLPRVPKQLSCNSVTHRLLTLVRPSVEAMAPDGCVENVVSDRAGNNQFDLGAGRELDPDDFGPLAQAVESEVFAGLAPDGALVNSLPSSSTSSGPRKSRPRDPKEIANASVIAEPLTLSAWSVNETRRTICSQLTGGE
jgi:hypothetical protein